MLALLLLTSAHARELVEHGDIYLLLGPDDKYHVHLFSFPQVDTLYPFQPYLIHCVLITYLLLLSTCIGSIPYPQLTPLSYMSPRPFISAEQRPWLPIQIQSPP